MAVEAREAAVGHGLEVVLDLAVDRDLVEERGPAVGRGRVEGRGLAAAGRATMRRVRRRCRGHRLQTFADRVAAKSETIGPQWATCPRPAVARVVPEIDLAVATLPIGRTRVIDLAEATSEVGPAQVLGLARVRDRSPDHDLEPADDRRRAICKTFLICRMLVVGISVAAGHQAALATGRPASGAH